MTDLKKEMTHSLSLSERERLCITGVVQVDSFDEDVIAMLTAKGRLIVRGQGLHIEKLSVDIGELTVEGTVNSLEYSDDFRTGGGFFARLFG